CGEHHRVAAPGDLGGDTQKGARSALSEGHFWPSRRRQRRRPTRASVQHLTQETPDTGYVMVTPIPHFDPGALSLEFAYAGGLGGVDEQWHAPEDLTAWVSARFGHLGPLAAPATERELVDAIHLRDAVATVSRAF